MPINRTCECGAETVLDEALAGMPYACPKCGREMRVPSPRGGADELARQMREVRTPTGPAAPGGTPLPGGRVSRLAPRPKRRPPKGVERAATHLGMKKVLWVPALLLGLACTVFGVGALLMAAMQYGTEGTVETQDLEELGITEERGRWGRVFTSKDKVGQTERFELIMGPDGRDWLIRDQADKLVWKITWTGPDAEGVPQPQSKEVSPEQADEAWAEAPEGAYVQPVAKATADGGAEWDLRVEPAEGNPVYEAVMANVGQQHTLGYRNVVFGILLLVLGPMLLGLAWWMRRDVNLVEASERASEMAPGEPPA